MTALPKVGRTDVCDNNINICHFENNGEISYQEEINNFAENNLLLNFSKELIEKGQVCGQWTKSLDIIFKNLALLA